MKVTLENHKIKVGSKEIPLFSGEIHYWRLSPSVWRRALEQIREMGLHVIATYVPWEYHEYERGKFDFTGHTDPQRNLRGFLELAREMDFYVIIRPGPYIYSEWKNDGVPDYAHQYHRLHPEFQKVAAVYLKKVFEIIRPFFATRAGGNIILIQADNEIDPWPDMFGAQYGLGSTPGMFQEFLKKKYRSKIAGLNLAWGAQYKNFTETRPFIPAAMENQWEYLLDGEHELRRKLDYFEFKHSYSNQYAGWTVTMFRSLGADIPIYLNVYPFLYAHDWEAMQRTCDLVGIDLYPYNELSENVYEPRKIIDKIRYLRTFSPIAYIAEFQSGIWHGRLYQLGALTPNHYRLLSLSALLAGCQGWNWYMIVNRDNWYMSPIDEWGKARGELFGVFKQLVHVTTQIEPADLKKRTDVAVTFNRMQYAGKTFISDCPVLHSLFLADIDYEFFDPLTETIRKPILFYSGNQWLDGHSQKNLRHYVEEGGILVLFQDYPRKDDSFKPSNYLDLHEPSSVLFEFKKNLRISMGKQGFGETVTQPYVFDRVDGKAIEIDLDRYGKKTVGYVKPIGKGKIVHLGVKPSASLMHHILETFDIPMSSRAQSPGLKTALFDGKKGKRYLVVINPSEEKQSDEILLPGAKFRKAQDLLSNQPAKIVPGGVIVSLPRKDGTVIELS
ncbi:MAG: beta-galactosidase [Candidatus Omnitrophica bacterium]|nr:beta-galactosidase [Candidatus Omnitrophota bacterium]